jgi:hypothetical protein
VGGGDECAGDEGQSHAEQRARETWGMGSHVGEAWREEARRGKRDGRREKANAAFRG